MVTPVRNVEPGTEIVTFCPASCGPAHCYDRHVWGGAGGVYADGSAICGAALQAGVVQEGAGGYVALLVTPSQWTYPGREQNGVKSGLARSLREGFIVAAVTVHRVDNDTANATLSPSSPFQNSTVSSATTP